MNTRNQFHRLFVVRLPPFTMSFAPVMAALREAFKREVPDSPKEELENNTHLLASVKEPYTVMQTVNAKRLDQMVNASEVLLIGGAYIGDSWRKLIRDGDFEEASNSPAHLTLFDVDQGLTQAYAALAVLGRIIHRRPDEHSSPMVASALEDIAAIEKARYGSEAFPYDNDPLKAAAIDAVVPPDIDPDLPPRRLIKLLRDQQIRHEWTVKPGRRLYRRLLAAFPSSVRGGVCGDNGLLARFRQTSDYVDTTKELTLLVAAVAGWENMYLPFAVTVSLIMVRRGLDRFCGNTD